MEEGASRGTAWRMVQGDSVEEGSSRGTAWRRVLAGEDDSVEDGASSVEEGASRGTAWRMVQGGGQRGGGC